VLFGGVRITPEEVPNMVRLCIEESAKRQNKREKCTYTYQYTPDPLTKESDWQIIYGTRCKKVIKDLPLGTKWRFRMGVIGPRNQMIYTEPLARYIA
jgi:hypothetical protein